MKAFAISVVLLLSAVSTKADGPPDPTDPGNISTNPPPTYTPGPPRTPENGVIHTTDLDVIEWWSLDHNVFEVEWRQKLTDGSWTNIGEGYTEFVHNYPEGFYRVIERSDKLVFPVWNDGTADMLWSATTDCPWLEVECANTNLPPEWGEGYVIAAITGRPPKGTKGYITAFSIGGNNVKTQRVTVVYTGE